MDSFMSDVHCLLLLCKESYKMDNNLNNKMNSKYCIKTHAKYSEQYTLSFDIKPLN